MKLSTYACLAQLDQHQTCKLVMVSVEATLFFEDTSMIILYKNDRNVRFVLFTKTSSISVYALFTEGLFIHRYSYYIYIVFSQFIDSVLIYVYMM